jgi:hypothetical protein
MTKHKKKERELVQAPKPNLKRARNYNKPSSVIKEEDKRNPFERVQITSYLYVWTKAKLDEMVANGEAANIARAMEIAVIEHYGFKKPPRVKRIQ